MNTVIKPQSKKMAILISYGSTFLSALASMVLLPVAIHYVGSDAYGLYQKIYALAQYLLVIDLGISSTVVRYATKARVEKDISSEQNFYGFMAKTTLVLHAFVLFFGIIFYFGVDVIYDSMNAEETYIARILILVMLLQTVLTIFEDFLIGIIRTYEQFVFTDTLKFIRLLCRLILIPIFLAFTKNIISIAIIDVSLTFIAFVLSLFYSLKFLKVSPKFAAVDKKVKQGIVALLLANLLQNISKYLNNGIDKVLIGRYLTNEDVTVYSVAMTFISFFMIISTVIQSVHLPQVVKLNEKGASIDELTDVVVKVGRIQLILCGGFLSGFIVLGQDFISLWAGPDSGQAWSIALIIMVPLLIPLIQNVCLCILTAKDKRFFRSLVMVLLSLVNLLVSIVLIKRFGLLGAPIGTAIAYALGNVIVMNIYYQKCLNIKVRLMFKRIFSRILPCIVLITIPLFFGFRMYLDGILMWCVKAIIFLTLYFLVIYFVGMQKDEKKFVEKILIKIKNIRRVG